MTDANTDACGFSEAAEARDAMSTLVIATRTSNDVLATASAFLALIQGGFFEFGAQQSCYLADLEAPVRNAQFASLRNYRRLSYR